MARLYELLCGRWSLNRRIYDHLGSVQVVSLVVSGTASWIPPSLPRDKQDVLLYTETGFLTKSGAPVENIAVTQSYEYRFSRDRPTHAEVLFSNGRVFHELVLSAGGDSGEIRHICHVGSSLGRPRTCHPDVYVGRYALSDDGASLVVDWNVSGPTTSYTSSTTFQKLST